MEYGYLITGYSIKESLLDNCIHICAYFEAEERWQTLGVNPSYYDWIPPWKKFVHSPNLIERLLGRTLESKLQKARKQVEKAAQKRMRRHNILNCAMKSVTE